MCSSRDCCMSIAEPAMSIAALRGGLRGVSSRARSMASALVGSGGPAAVRVAAAGPAAGGFPHARGLRTRVEVAAAAKGKSKSGGGRTESSRGTDGREMALQNVLQQIDSQFGKGSVVRLGEEPAQKVETVSTGSVTLDLAMGGGFPKGRISEVYGPESSGKTTLALHAMAEVQKAGGVAALIDAEHAFDPVYSKRLGVDVQTLLVCQPESGEMALEVVDQLVRSGAVDIIAVDSVAALTPRAELEGEVGSVTMGAQARLMSHALRKITSNCAKSNCTVIFLNQLRSKIGVIYGSPEVTSGGNALKFYASVRLDIRRYDKLEGAKGEFTGVSVRVKVVKNKIAPPYRQAEFDILFGSGIDTIGCVIALCKQLGIIEAKGSFLYYEGNILAQGMPKTVAKLKEDPELFQELKAKSVAAMQEHMQNEFSVGGEIMGGKDELDANADLDEDLEEEFVVVEGKLERAVAQ